MEFLVSYSNIAQSTGVVEYTDCISAEGYDLSQECTGEYIKYSDGEASVMLELWGTWRTPSLPLLPGSLCAGVLAHERILTMC